MAGYVKLQRSIWQDPDFIGLHADDQRLYMLLISQADLSHVGILPLTAGRWAGLGANTKAADIRLCLDRLEAANFLVVDHDTEEVLVRTYLIHDEAFKLTNGKTSLTNAYGRVLSQRLAGVIAEQLSTVGVTVEPTVSTTVEPFHHPSASIQHPSSSTPTVESAVTPSSAESIPDDDEGAIDQIIALVAAKRTKNRKTKTGDSTAYCATTVANAQRNERAAIAELLIAKPYMREQHQVAADWYELARQQRSA